jgi:hypothetical protein
MKYVIFLAQYFFTCLNSNERLREDQPELDNQVLFYTAVPKTASVTTGGLLATSAKKEGAKCFYNILWRTNGNASRHHTKAELVRCV